MEWGRLSLLDIEAIGIRLVNCGDLGLQQGDEICYGKRKYLRCVSENAPLRRKRIPRGKFCCDHPTDLRIDQVDSPDLCTCSQFPLFVERNDLLGDPVSLNTNPFNPDYGLHGVAVLDYNNDGFDDIFFVGANENIRGHWLFRNNGGSFTDVTQAAGLDIPSDSIAVVAVDLNNDDYIDLVLGGGASRPGPEFYQNNGDGTFTRFTDTANVHPAKVHPLMLDLEFPGESHHISAGDYDNDGFVDLFFADQGDLHTRIFSDARLYRNNGNMTFTDVSLVAFPFTVIESCVSIFNDYDHDGYIDLYIGVCNGAYLKPTPNFLFRNNGDGTFSDVSNSVDLGYENNMAFPMSATLGDWNRDGQQDMFITSLGNSAPVPPPGFDHLFLLANAKQGRYEQFSRNIGTSPTPYGWGSVMVDLDNDGWLDLAFLGNMLMYGMVGNPGFIYQSIRCSGDPSCKKIKRQVLLRQTLDLSVEHSSGFAYGDFNNDGWVDFVANSVNNPGVDLAGGTGNLSLFMNSGVACDKKHYIAIGLIGTRSNRMGIGSTIRVDVGGESWYAVMTADSSFASTNSRYMHFGFKTFLDNATVYVQWLGSGIIEKFESVIDVRVLLREGSGIAVP